MNQSNKDENVRCIKTEFGDPAELRTEKVPKLLQVSLTFSVPLAFLKPHPWGMALHTAGPLQCISLDELMLLEESHSLFGR